MKRPGIFSVMSRILILILMNLPGKMVLLIGLNMLQLKKTIRDLKITADIAMINNRLLRMLIKMVMV